MNSNDNRQTAGSLAGLENILARIKWNQDGLVPAIAQDQGSKEVLMMAYMNKEALIKTITGGKACYYSRSRQALWLKGETSGHYQEIVDIRLDCDGDTILLTVKQTGMACHEDFFTCFHYRLEDAVPDESGCSCTNCTCTEPKSTSVRNWAVTGTPQRKAPAALGGIIEELAQVIRQRNNERPEGAYTTYLFNKGIDKILKKVGEECAEVIIAAKNNSVEEIRYEASDLIYHLLVLLEDRGVGLHEITEELASRRK